jgi:D-glycero-D-manno-heptose 1,7-bisphosphate phosphatase
MVLGQIDARVRVILIEETRRLGPKTIPASPAHLPQNLMAKALFLDRDGTLIIDKVYLADPAGVELIPGVAAGLARALRLGYRLFLFTNQSGIGRGYHTLEDTHRVNARMEEVLGLPRPVFTDICIAPEAPGQPVVYRKPSPRFILESMARHRLDPAQCWMVGDSAADIGAGLGARIKAAAVRTGKVDPSDLPEVKLGLVPVFADFREFAATLA